MTTTDLTPAQLTTLARHGWQRQQDHWRDAGDDVRDDAEAQAFATRQAIAEGEGSK